MEEKLAFVVERKMMTFTSDPPEIAYCIELGEGGYVGPEGAIVSTIHEARPFPRKEVAEGIAKSMGYTLL